MSGQPPGRWVAGDDRYQARSETGTATCETGAALTLRGLASGQWQSWDLEARSIADLGKGVRFEFDGATVRVTNDSPKSIERGIFVQTGREPMVIPFGEIPRGGRTEGAVGTAAPDPYLALGFGPDTLGDRVLRPWFSGIVWKPRLDAPLEPTRRFLLCVLPEERPPVQVDARVSDRSRALTLLHVAEAP